MHVSISLERRQVLRMSIIVLQLLSLVVNHGIKIKTTILLSNNNSGSFADETKTLLRAVDKTESTLNKTRTLYHFFNRFT